VTIRIGKTVRISDTPMQPGLSGCTGTVIWRRGRMWCRVRLDDHPEPLGPEGKGWFLPQSAVQPC
jgi:hypothetical protein